jgi:predicted ribosome quality control (RQC) complex YloA/Tae2 family protein
MAGLVATSTVTLNVAFLQEIKEVNEELWQLLDRLRYTCSRPLDITDHSRFFAGMLSELRDQLALHFALEEAYGYFEDPAEVNAYVSREADRLRNEHRRLYSQISKIAERAEVFLEEGHYTLLATTIPGQFILFDAALQNHENHENELLMQAIDNDIGVGD